MSTPNEAPAHCVDAVVRDAVEGVRTDGHIPDVQAIRGYVQGIVEKMDRKDADNRHRIRPKKVRPQRAGRAPASHIKEANRRLAARGLPGLMDPEGWDVTRGGNVLDRERLNRASRKLKHGEVFGDYEAGLLSRRIRLMKNVPEYNDMLSRINPYARDGSLGPKKKRHALFLTWKAIKASAAHFGPWWKPPPKRLWFS